MISFKDSVSGKIYNFDDGVVVNIDTSGVYSIETPTGLLIDTPTTLQPYTVPSPTSSELLAAAQAEKIVSLSQSYQSAILALISYTTVGGVTEIFQADTISINNLNNMMQAYGHVGSTPAGFYWVAENNTRVSFSLADLQGLATSMGDRGWAAFQNLQNKKSAVLSAPTVADVQAVAW